ncbi:hypothetical protein Bca4012_065523 [Brassica carinata]
MFVSVHRTWNSSSKSRTCETTYWSDGFSKLTNVWTGFVIIQKCIESMPAERIGFVIAAFRGQVSTLSTHPYGCRVIQRTLEHCSDDEETRCIIDEILESAFALAHDHTSTHPTLWRSVWNMLITPRELLIEEIKGKYEEDNHLLSMMKDQYANYVVQKVLEISKDQQREILVQRIKSLTLLSFQT